MKRQILFYLCLCCLCAGILVFPYRVEREPAVREGTSESGEPSFDEGLVLEVLHGEKVVKMTLSSYLVGVVSAEMPHSFPMEALKAQAVAARTFTLKSRAGGKHPDGDVCTDSSCCQAWTEELSPHAVEAVLSTDGIVLTYGEELIDATYFSCSGGRTEAAVAVWGSDVPYLQAVDSPGEEEAPRFRETVELSPEAFAARLQSLRPELSLRGSPIKWFGEIRYTVGNGIDVVQIGGAEFKGTELRKLFGLRSTNMRFCVTDEGITVSTLGYGHRVGLSQYGAKAMAEQEQDYTRILCHYYQKAEIKRLFHQEEA